MLKSHVDERGRQVSSVKHMVGGEGKPVAGSLEDPEMKWTTSLIFTSPVPDSAWDPQCTAHSQVV